MQPFSSIYYATPSPATADTSKPKEGDSPSCCTRIMNVVKSVISWIVYIFTFGFVTVFELSDAELLKKAEQLSKDEKPAEEVLEVLVQVEDAITKHKTLHSFIKEVLLKDKKTRSDTLVDFLKAFSDEKRDAECLYVLDHIPKDYDTSELRSLCRDVTALVQNPLEKSKAIVLTVTNLRFLLSVSINEYKQLILKIPAEHITQRIEAVDQLRIRYQHGSVQSGRLDWFDHLFTFAEWMGELATQDADNATKYLAERMNLYQAVSLRCAFYASVQANISKEGWPEQVDISKEDVLEQLARFPDDAQLKDLKIHLMALAQTRPARTTCRI